MAETVVAQGLIFLKSHIHTSKLDERQLRGTIKKHQTDEFFEETKI